MGTKVNIFAQMMAYLHGGATTFVQPCYLVFYKKALSGASLMPFNNKPVRPV